MMALAQSAIAAGGILVIGFVAGLAVFYLPCLVFLVRVGVQQALLPRAARFAAAVSAALVGGALLMGVGGPVLAVLVFVSLCRKYLVVTDRRVWTWAIVMVLAGMVPVYGLLVTGMLWVAGAL